ncbi:unnamed protein product [Symbiodinium sp. CCMP2592]|nr:unnamed protein product [Symbiodinium sp. CCMP2592]
MLPRSRSSFSGSQWGLWQDLALPGHSLPTCAPLVQRGPNSMDRQERRRRRQSKRPCQLNRLYTDIELEPEVVTISPDREAPADRTTARLSGRATEGVSPATTETSVAVESSRHPSSVYGLPTQPAGGEYWVEPFGPPSAEAQLTPNEVQRLKFIRWKTRHPPPTTVYLRPYLRESAGPSSSHETSFAGLGCAAIMTKATGQPLDANPCPASMKPSNAHEETTTRPRRRAKHASRPAKKQHQGVELCTDGESESSPSTLSSFSDELGEFASEMTVGSLVLRSVRPLPPPTTLAASSMATGMAPVDATFTASTPATEASGASGSKTEDPLGRTPLPRRRPAQVANEEIAEGITPAGIPYQLPKPVPKKRPAPAGLSSHGPSAPPSPPQTSVSKEPSTLNSDCADPQEVITTTAPETQPPVQDTVVTTVPLPTTSTSDERKQTHPPEKVKRTKKTTTSKGDATTRGPTQPPKKKRGPKSKIGPKPRPAQTADVYDPDYKPDPASRPKRRSKWLNIGLDETPVETPKRGTATGDSISASAGSMQTQTSASSAKIRRPTTRVNFDVLFGDPGASSLEASHGGAFGLLVPWTGPSRVGEVAAGIGEFSSASRMYGTGLLLIPVAPSLKSISAWQHPTVSLSVRQMWAAYKDWKRATRAAKTAQMQALTQSMQEATDKGDVRALFRLAASLSPQKRRPRLQLRGPQGELWTPQQQLDCLRQHYEALYASPDTTDTTISSTGPPLPTTSPTISFPDFTVTDVLEGLLKLPPHKAAPPGKATSSSWVLCARELAPWLHHKISHLDQVPSDWRDAWMSLLPKVTHPMKPKDLRPLGITEISGRVAAGLVQKELRPYLVELLAAEPQFAYAPGRSTDAALSRVFAHCEKVIEMCTPAPYNILDSRFAPAAKPLASGGLTYHLTIQGMKARIPAGRGLRQGCRISPLVWSMATIVLLHDLGDRIGDHHWVRAMITAFADDIHGGELITTTAQLDKLLINLGHLLDVLIVLLQRGKDVMFGRQRLASIACNIPQRVFPYAGYAKNAFPGGLVSVLTLNKDGPANALPTAPSVTSALTTTVQTVAPPDVSPDIAQPVVTQDPELRDEVRHHCPECSQWCSSPAGVMTLPATGNMAATPPPQPEASINAKNQELEMFGHLFNSFSNTATSGQAAQKRPRPEQRDAVMTPVPDEASLPRSTATPTSIPKGKGKVKGQGKHAGKSKGKGKGKSKGPQSSTEVTNRTDPWTLDTWTDPDSWSMSGWSVPSLTTAESSSTLLMQVARMTLRHEQQLHILQQDTRLFLYLKPNQEYSVLPMMLQLATEWRQTMETTPTKLTMSLREIMIRGLLREWKTRLQAFQKSEETKITGQRLQWLDSLGHWNYMHWCPIKQELVLTERQESRSTEEILTMIQEMEELITGDSIKNFKSMRQLRESYQTDWVQFLVEVQLRGPGDKLWTIFNDLIGSAALHLLAARLRRNRYPYSGLAQSIQAQVW